MAKKRNEEEIAATVGELPTVPPNGWLDYMLSENMLRRNVLIYRVAYVVNPLTEKKEKMVRVTCTACGETAYLEYAGGSDGCHCGGSTFGFIDPADDEAKRSGNTCICPCCGRGMEAKHIGHISPTYVIEKELVVSLHEVRGHIAVLSWMVEKSTDREGTVTVLPHLYEGVIVVVGKLVRVKGYVKWIGGRIAFYKRWEALKQFLEEFPYVDNECVLPFEDHIEYGTELENSALTELLREARRVNVAKYIKLWKKFPSVEAVVKAGAANYVGEAIGCLDQIKGYYYNAKYRLHLEDIGEYFNVKEKKPTRILGVEKDEWQLVTKGYHILNYYKTVKSLRGVKLTVGEIMTARNLGWKDPNQFLSNGWGGYLPPVVRTIRYLEKQAKKHGSIADARYYEDFLGMQVKVYGSIDPERCFPKNIIKAHDALLLAVEEKEYAEINQKMQERLKEIGCLAFTDERLGLFIKPCESHGEIIKEGKVLSHCVGGYAKSHAEGKTTILFIRRIAEPEMPYFTLEYKNGVVAQNRGYHNCARTDEVATFEEEWLNYIKRLKEKKDGNGRRKKAAAGA